MEEDFYVNWFGHRSPRAVQPCRGPMPHLVAFACKDDVSVDNYITKAIEDDDVTSWPMLLQEAYDAYPRDTEQGVQEYVTHQMNMAFEVNRIIDAELKKSRASRPIKVDKRKQTVSNYHLITFTYDPEEDTEETVKPKMDKFERSKFKNYKYVCTEEKFSADNQKYHRHYIVECTNRQAHTQNGLKRNPGHYYTGNINSKPIKMTATDLERVMKYLHKENNPRGDVDYFRQKFAELFSKLKV